jgi:hypothetical protein
LGSLLLADRRKQTKWRKNLIKSAAVSVSMIAVFAAGLFAAPVAAQKDASQPGDEKINQLIIYGDDPCPQSKSDEIVVCARLEEEQRYRIPSKLRSDPNSLSKEAWAQRVKAYEYVGASGIGSCSTKGEGSYLGCGLRDIDVAYAEKAQDPGLFFGRLIAEARAKRLSGIDAEAEEIEDVVLAEERAAALKKLQDQGNSVAADPEVEVADDPEPARLPEPK